MVNCAIIRTLLIAGATLWLRRLNMDFYPWRMHLRGRVRPVKITLSGSIYMLAVWRPFDWSTNDSCHYFRLPFAVISNQSIQVEWYLVLCNWHFKWNMGVGVLFGCSTPCLNFTYLYIFLLNISHKSQITKKKKKKKKTWQVPMLLTWFTVFASFCVSFCSVYTFYLSKWFLI